jgi:hypothetical protein
MRATVLELKLERADVHMRAGFSREAALIIFQSVRRVKQGIVTSIEGRTSMEQSHGESRTAIVCERAENWIERSVCRTGEIIVNAVDEAGAAVGLANQVVAQRGERTLNVRDAVARERPSIRPPCGTETADIRSDNGIDYGSYALIGVCVENPARAARAARALATAAGIVSFSASARPSGTTMVCGNRAGDQKKFICG